MGLWATWNQGSKAVYCSTIALNGSCEIEICGQWQTVFGHVVHLEYKHQIWLGCSAKTNWMVHEMKYNYFELYSRHWGAASTSICTTRVPWLLIGERERERERYVNHDVDQSSNPKAIRFDWWSVGKIVFLQPGEAVYDDESAMRSSTSAWMNLFTTQSSMFEVNASKSHLKIRAAQIPWLLVKEMPQAITCQLKVVESAHKMNQPRQRDVHCNILDGMPLIWIGGINTKRAKSGAGPSCQKVAENRENEKGLAIAKNLWVP